MPARPELVLIALFLTVALNPAVELLRRRGLGRGAATGTTFVLALAIVGGFGRASRNKVPDYVHDLTHGRGRLGFLETSTTSSRASGRR